MCDYCRKLWTLHIDFKKTGKFLCINRYYAFFKRKGKQICIAKYSICINLKKKYFCFTEGQVFRDKFVEYILSLSRLREKKAK